MNKPKSTTDSYPIKTTGVCINVSIMLLISVVTSIIPLLLNSNTAIFYTSQPLYITIIVLFFVLMYYKFWGVLVGAGTFLICGTMLELPSKILLINSTVNIIQLVLLLISYLYVSKKNLHKDIRHFLCLFIIFSCSYHLSCI